MFRLLFVVSLGHLYLKLNHVLLDIFGLVIMFMNMERGSVQKLGRLLADFVQTFRPAAKMVSIAGHLPHCDICYISLCVRKFIRAEGWDRWGYNRRQI